MSTPQTTIQPDRYGGLDPRTQRAVVQEMIVTTRGPGIYRVKSQSGTAYIVDLPTQSEQDNNRSSATCTCPDYETSGQADRCKHIRRVRLDIAAGELRAPDKPAIEDSQDENKPLPAESVSSPKSSIATDGGKVATTAQSMSETAFDMSVDTLQPAPRYDLYQRIATRVREIESTIKERQTELRELEGILSTLEGLSETSSEASKVVTE